MPVIASWTERHWKWLFLVLASSLYGAYKGGEHAAERRYEAERHQSEVQAVERERALQQQISEAQSQAVKKVEVVRWRTRTIQAQVNELAKTANTDCRLDADGLRLWNAAHAGSTGGTQ